MDLLDLLEETGYKVRQVYGGQKVPVVPRDLFAKVERSPGNTPTSPPLIQTTLIDTERRNRSLGKRSRHTMNRVQIAIQAPLDTKTLARNRSTKIIRAPTMTKNLRDESGGRSMSTPTLSPTPLPLPLPPRR